jgi:Na+/melibiose symporter-like transporter
MNPRLWPVRTAQKQAPWLWVGFLAGPWAAMFYFEQISNVAITFKLREFVSAPVVITAVGSFNLIFNIFVGATCNYTSDRVWTRIGRRKPFLLAGWLIVAVGCIVLPSLDTLWLIVGVLFIYEMLRDVAAPYESLVNEVMPPHQRGRTNASLTFARQAMSVFFFAVMIGQWDNLYALPGGLTVTGQQLVFWTGSAFALGCFVLLSTGLRETAPKTLPPPPPRLSGAAIWRVVRDFFHNVFGNRQWLSLYAVAISQMIFWIGFGSLTPLLFTEQWGFSKQTYGTIIALGAPFTLFLFLPIGGWLADRIDRLLLFKLLAGTITCLHLAFFLYLKLRPGEGAPPLGAVLTYGLLQTGVGNIGVVCTVSMMFDFVPRDRLGTVSSGIGITRGVVSILINNGIGLWITAATALTTAHPPGEAIVYDYESGYLYLVLCGLVATGVAFWFARQVDTGRITKLGVIEATEPASP